MYYLNNIKMSEEKKKAIEHSNAILAESLREALKQLKRDELKARMQELDKLEELPSDKIQEELDRHVYDQMQAQIDEEDRKQQELDKRAIDKELSDAEQWFLNATDQDTFIYDDDEDI